MTLPLQLSGLSVHGKGRVLLTVDALDLPAGSLVGIRGPSGAGKSTLLHALAGLSERTRGCVVWGDTNLITLTERQRTAFRADHVGMIFQDFLLFEELSAQDNAALVSLFRRRKARRPIAARAAAHLSRLTVPATDRPVADFSGGERQRVAIARALAHDPAILLADEPTASLHREAADRLIDDLTGLARDGGKTLIAVSHDAALLARMDRVLTIEDGRITQDAIAA